MFEAQNMFALRRLAKWFQISIPYQLLCWFDLSYIQQLCELDRQHNKTKDIFQVEPK
jgi:hypothetical protein